MFVPIFKPYCFAPIAPFATSAMQRVTMPSVMQRMPFMQQTSMPMMSSAAMTSAITYQTAIFMQNMINFIKSIPVTFKNYYYNMPKQTTPSYQFGSITSNWRTPARSISSNFASTSSLKVTNDPTLWQRLGYCAKSGYKLAQTALSRAVGFTGYCARYVKNAIASCGLGPVVSGNACDMVNILRRNKNFKEIQVSGADLKKLPAGCVLVYDRGISGYSARYGHTEITTGDGRAVSDGITKNIRGRVTAVFMPVA